MSEYLEYFETQFPADIADRTAPENWPYVAYCPNVGVLFTKLMSNVGPNTGVDAIDDADLNARSYGVYWTDEDIVASADNMTKIGISGLPIHNQLKRGVYNIVTKVYSEIDFDTVDPSSFTLAENETVVVHVPSFYGRSWQMEKDGVAYNVVRISEEQIDDTWYHIPECYVNAWCNTGNGLSRVYNVAEGTEYYQVSTSLIDARAESVAAGGVTLYYDLYKWLFIWLPVIEFGTFATTREYKVTDLDMSSMTGTFTNEYVDEITVTNSEGAEQTDASSVQVGELFYLEGTMGFGLVNHPQSLHNVTTPGATLCLGNRTGKVVLTVDGVSGVAEGPCCAYSWRGFENVAGDIAQLIDGFIILAVGEDNTIYTSDDTALLSQALISDQTDFTGYRSTIFPAELSNGMILPTKLSMGENGDFIPANDDMGGAIAGFNGGHNLSGMSDSSYLGFGSSPRACLVGSVGDWAADGGALYVALFGPGYLGTGDGLSSGFDFVGFRTVFTA